MVDKKTNNYNIISEALKSGVYLKIHPCNHLMRLFRSLEIFGFHPLWPTDPNNPSFLTLFLGPKESTQTSPGSIFDISSTLEPIRAWQTNLFSLPTLKGKCNQLWCVLYTFFEIKNTTQVESTLNVCNTIWYHRRSSGSGISWETITINTTLLCCC